MPASRQTSASPAQRAARDSALRRLSRTNRWLIAASVALTAVLAEVVARVRAQLRVVADASASTLRAADIEVNLLTRKVSREGRTVALSTTEFELLEYLMRHCGHVLTREQILSSVWGYEHDPATNVVDVYIGYLRRKLGRPDDPAPIFTVRSVGYRLGNRA